MSAPLEIIDPLSYPAWDSIVAACRRPCLFHTSGWARVLHDTYGYQPYYVARIEGGKLTTLLPLMEVKSVLTGTRAVSLPFTDYCDPIVREEDAGCEVLEFLNAYGERRKWRSWELRGGDIMFRQTPPSSRYIRHMLDLSKDAEVAYAMLKSSTKRNINKAEREGVTVLWENTLSAVRVYYQLHCRTRRRHGLPPQPYRFFQKLHEHVISRGQGQILLGQYQGKTIAGAIFLRFGREAIYKFGASDCRYLHLRPNDLIMWTAIREHGRDGYEQFSFGRTDHDNVGLLQFKTGWGAQEQQIRYFKYDLRRSQYVRNGPQVRGRHNTLFRNMPLPLLKLVGSALYRHIG